MTDIKDTASNKTQAVKHTPDAEALADAILKPSGSNLKNYTMASTREAILSAAQKGIDDARAGLLADMRFVREWFTENGLEEEYHGICEYLDESIASFTGKGAA